MVEKLSVSHEVIMYLFEACITQYKNLYTLLEESAYRPHDSVKAVKSTLNLGSPRPPVVNVPLGLSTCWSASSATTNWSMRGFRLSSSPRIKLDASLSACGMTKVRADALVDNEFENQRAVSNPSITIVWVLCTGTCNNNARLK
jgi:hypothetical protein